MLRKAREATGLHIAALAVAMKVPVKKLEALEADRLEELPDAVFTRALAASMCRALKMDPAPVLSRLPQTAAPKFDRDDRGINMPYSATGLPFGGSLRSLASRPAVLLVSALLLAALAVVFYPVARNVETSPAASKASNVPAAVPAEVGKLVAANAETVASNVQPAPAVAVDVVTPSAAPVPAAAASLAAGVIASAAGTVPNVVVFKATSSAWVRVSDSKGVLQFEKTLDAGETAGASGTPPLSIVVGNVGATEVMVRGQPFRLDEFAKNNVARFEVK
jgi:cytoskeleton protein RodZ